MTWNSTYRDINYEKPIYKTEFFYIKFEYNFNVTFDSLIISKISTFEYMNFSVQNPII